MTNSDVPGGRRRTRPTRGTSSRVSPSGCTSQFMGVRGRPRSCQKMPSDDGNGDAPRRSVGASPRLRRHRRGVPADELAVVVVHAERVDRASRSSRGRPGGSRRAARHRRSRRRCPCGYCTAEDRVEEPAVELPVDAPGGIEVGGVRRVDRVGDGEVQRDAEVQRRVARAQLAHRLPVAEQQVVGCQHALALAVVPGRVQARGVAEERRAPRLVERGPHVHPVAERVVHVERVLGEALGGVADGPAALLLQRLRQIPVVQRQPRQDAGIQQLVDEALVEVDALRVERAAVGAHARPRRREAVRLQSHGLHERDVVAVAGGSGRTPRRRCRR